MKKTFLLRVAALLMAMLMVLAVFAGCKNKKKENGDDEESVDTSASAVFRNALVSLFTDLGEIPALKTWLNMCQQGSLEMDAEIDAGKLAASMGETGVEGSVSAGYKFYFGGSAGIFMENVYVDIESPRDNIDFNISGDVFLSPEYIYVKNDSVLGGAIGLVSGETTKAFENSIWKEELDKAIQEGGVPSEMVEIVMSLLKMYDGEMGDVAQDVIEDIKPVVERYITVISASLEKNAKFVEETKTVTVGGEAVESRVVTLVVDKAAVVGFINDLYAAVKGDSELRSLIVKYGDMLENYVGMSGAEIGMAYDNFLKMLDEEMDSLEEEISEFAVMVAVTTPTDASTLRKLEIFMRDGDESAETETIVTLDAGKNGVKNAKRIELNIMDETVIAYETIKNDESGYKASLVINSYGDIMTLFTIDVNRSAGTYSLSIPMGDFAMGGTFKVEGDKTTIVFNSITIEGETYNKGFSLIMVIKENDKMPAVVDKNDVTSIFELTKGNIVDIVDRFEKVFEDFLGAESNKGEATMPDYNY